MIVPRPAGVDYDVEWDKQDRLIRSKDQMG